MEVKKLYRNAVENIIVRLGKILSPFKVIIKPIQKVWPFWLSARNPWIRRGVPILSVPTVIYLYMLNFKNNVYPGLAVEEAVGASCAALPGFMQGGIGQIMTSTAWFPSFITTRPRTETDWFYAFWQTMDYQLAIAMGLAVAFTLYAILKMLEIRARAIALGEGTGIARDAGAAAGAGAAAAIGVTLATCWGPALLALIFGVNVISFSGATEAVFHFTIPKPFVLLFVTIVVAAGMYWINHKEQACELLEEECK
jgi:hypothetical protein